MMTNDMIKLESNLNFPDCTNCIRYFDTVICKCEQEASPDIAFMYPSNITPSTDFRKIVAQ